MTGLLITKPKRWRGNALWSAPFSQPESGIPSEGGTKKGESCTPSEGGKCTATGETRRQGALEAVTTQHTFGKWDENAGKLHTFRRWEMHSSRRNTEAGRSRSCDDSAHLRKVRRKRGNPTHLWKVEKRMLVKRRVKEYERKGNMEL